MTGGYIFTLSTLVEGGGTPFQLWVGGYPISGLGRGVPHLRSGVPHLRSGWGGTQVWMVGCTLGTPLTRSGWWGVPQPGQDGGVYPGYTRPGLGGGDLIPGLDGWGYPRYPHDQVWMVGGTLTRSGWWGLPRVHPTRSGWGVPHPRSGWWGYPRYPHDQVWIMGGTLGTPLTRSGWWGVPPTRSGWWGVPRVPPNQVWMG